DAVYRIALAYPEVALSLIHNGKRTFQTSGSGDLRQVVASIYGVGTAKKTVPIAAQSIDFDVSGLVVKPEVTRASRQHMMIFMNGRYIRNYPITRAILEGFHTLLPIRRFPITVICIQMDPTLIDVNVHPSKLEARLSKETEVCQLVAKAIKDALRKLQLIPESVVPKQRKEVVEQQQFRFEQKETRTNDPLPSSKAKSSLQDPFPKQESRESSASQTGDIVREPSAGEIYEQTAEERNVTDPLEAEFDLPEVYEFKEENKESEPAGFQEGDPSSDEDRLPIMYPIGQMQGTYILAQNDRGLYIIDQHAAQERIKYEFYREKVGQVSKEVQELLVPITFEFSSAEAAIVEENREVLNEVGVFLEPFGQGTYLVRSHPQWFPEGFEKETIEDIVYQVMEEKKVNIAKLREEAAILMSCKRSIKANHHLRNDEMFALLNSLRETADPFTCPHGRPIVIHFSTYEMEKMFKRVM
ncbi:MAG TPA: DNA mismatch repair endonuclease MutL, partial [Bacillales bacterium]|nr:DNA mismatch repair endonuclease MutL [Bacillales bacterium]